MHPLSPLTPLPSELWPKCVKYGIDIVQWYKDHPERARLADHGLETNPYMQALWKAAELIFAIEHNIPLSRVNLTVGDEDKGSDMSYLGKLIDVKGTLWSGQYLIWPKHKNHLLAGKRFDALALVKMNEGPQKGCPSGTTWGWISKAEFQKKYRVAGPDHALDEGTFYVHQDELHAMSKFPGRRAPMVMRSC